MLLRINPVTVPVSVVAAAAQAERDADRVLSIQSGTPPFKWEHPRLAADYVTPSRFLDRFLLAEDQDGVIVVPNYLSRTPLWWDVYSPSNPRHWFARAMTRLTRRVAIVETGRS